MGLRFGRPTKALRKLFAISLLLAAPVGALAAAGPMPPCAGDPVPAYPATGAPPAVEVWRGDALAGDPMPRCGEIQLAGAAVLVALAGRFEAPTLDAILSRLGAISALARIKYWSISDGDYERLFEHAAAVTGPDGKRRRADFTATEIKRGGSLYFVETDNRTGSDVVYRLRFRETAPERFLISVDNVSAVTWLGIPLLGPGDLKFVYFLRHAQRHWDFYALSRVSTDLPLMSLFIRSQSYVNRARAIYRFLAAVP
jgi:Family of unknown function (DUF6675)